MATDELEDVLGTLVTDFETGRSRLRRLRIDVEEGPDRGQSLALPAGTRFIGSQPGVDLVLHDPKVSRRHVEVQVLDGRVRVRDLGSKNGTFHGDARIDSAELPPGARLLVGKSVLLIAADDEDVELGDGERSFDNLHTDNPELRRTFALLARAARSDVTVLVTGETGVGKDVLARAIHRQSRRRERPFVVLDCAALTPTLAASALFGHKKGAFTGALQDSRGVFEEADGGTLFIDEIGELPLELQPMLLRVLETRQVVPVGEVKGRPVDVRVLAATNRNLRAEADAGRFRSDLFFRLAVIRVHVPPLRDRLEDLPLLVRRLLSDLGRNETGFPPGDMAALRAYAWPGNVRELRNVVAQSVALSDDSLRLFGWRAEPGDDASTGAAAAGGDDDDDALSDLPYREARAGALDAFEARYIRALLEAHDGNVSKAARAAGIDRHYVHRLMRRHGVQR